MINTIMKIKDVLGENFSGAFASVAMPMTPGTKKEYAKRSVYGTKATKKPAKTTMIKR